MSSHATTNATPKQAVEQPVSLTQSTESPPDHEEWKPFASFVVELQSGPRVGKRVRQRTKVHHIEADTCAQWPGVPSRQLCRWMMEQIKGLIPE